MLYEKMEREGKPSPLQGEPSVEEEGLSYWRAFLQLHSSRPVGMGASPLPTSDVLAWLQMNGIADAEEQATYYRIVKALDEHWLSWARNALDEERERNKKK